MKIIVGGIILALVSVLIMTTDPCERPDGSLKQNCEVVK